MNTQDKDPYEMTRYELITEIMQHRNHERRLYKVTTQTKPGECEIKSHKACKCGDHCMYGKKRNLNE